jgi:hypothetical protein
MNEVAISGSSGSMHIVLALGLLYGLILLHVMREGESGVGLLVKIRWRSPETEIRAGEGTGGKDREGHPPHDAAEILGRRQDPYRAGGPARRGEHRRALPP